VDLEKIVFINKLIIFLFLTFKGLL